MDTPMCLWCSMPLPARFNWRTQIVVCATCDTQYTLALILNRDPETWERVRHRDGYEVTRDGRVLVVTEVVSA